MNNWKVRSFRSSCVYRRGCSTLTILEIDETANSTFRIHNGFLWNSFLLWKKKFVVLKGWVSFFLMLSEKNYCSLYTYKRIFLEFLFHDRENSVAFSREFIVAIYIFLFAKYFSYFFSKKEIVMKNWICIFETIFVVENNRSLFLDCGFYLSEDKYFENISNNKKNEIETLWFILYYIV